MSYKTIQIQSYEYLDSQRHIGPNVNDDMLRLAGETYHNVNISNTDSRGFLNFKGWVWRPDWFTVLEPVKTPLTQEQLNLSHTLTTALNNQDFPNDLEYIEIVSKHAPNPITIELGQFTLKTKVTTGPTQMYMKFKGASAYNVSEYLGLSSRRLDRSVENIAENYGNGRNKELYVAQTFVALHKGVEAWADTYRQATGTHLFSYGDDIAVYGNSRFDFIKRTDSTFAYLLPSIFERGSYEVSTMIIFLAAVHYYKATPIDADKKIDWHEIDLLNPPFDDSKAYIKRYDGLLPVDKATIESVAPVVKSQLLGFYMIGRDDIEQRIFEIKFRTMWCRITQTNVYEPFDDALLDLFHRAQSLNYISKYHDIGVLYKGSVYHPNAVDTIKEREALLASLGIDTSQDLYAVNDLEDYDYEPYITFFGDSDAPHFGVELEVDKGGDDPELSVIEKVLGVDFAYYMRDGSLNDGFEIATMPATLDYHMNHKPRYEAAFKLLEEGGYRSHDTSTCGLHIHFDRTALGSTRATQNLKASFLALILERNWNQVIKFSRRDFRRLEQWAKNQKLIGDVYHDDDEAAVVRKFVDKYANGDKYNALNCNHSKSFELRIFRGTLKANTFIATLQFVSNLVSVARECKTLDQAQRIKFEDIINYKPYDELNAYIAERNLNLQGGEQ